MALRSFVTWLALLIVGGAAGWVGGYQWALGMRKAEGAVAFVEAHNAERKGDLDTAVWYATQALALYPDLPTVESFANVLWQRRARAVCPDGQPGRTPK